MKKIVISICICIGIALLFTACLKESPVPAPTVVPALAVVPETSESPIEATPQDTPAEQTNITYSDIIYCGFTEAVSCSDVIVVGEYVAPGVFEDNGNWPMHTFKVKEVWRGDVPDETVHLFGFNNYYHIIEGGSYQAGSNDFEKGREYLLIMESHDSLYFDFTQYAIIGNMYIPIEDFSQSTMYGEPLEMHTDEVFEDLAALHEWIQNAEPPEPKVKNFTTATDLPTIVEESGLVLQVKITGIAEEGAGNSRIYNCEILEEIKGGSTESLLGRNDIWLSLQLGKVEVGETYIVLVNRLGEDSLACIQSSLNSVFPLSETETIEEIYALVAGD
ncbi:MAG: hypothetical protein LBM28_01145 [Oscillospiraceae bacterium]|jgi:hypothetical protein|nr:hypothetical protein [Oscillospiraceae bacterium]